VYLRGGGHLTSGPETRDEPNRDLRIAQAEYFDHALESEFEINRPHDGPRFYTYLMEYKFRRAVDLLARSLSGEKVLSVCAGSGMDAEFLVKEGCRVVAIDISRGALARAAARARRYQIEYELVAADAERLPFADLTFDYCFVHDGLHHLATPETAVREMARVSRKGLVISEPGDGPVTRVATGLGLMSRYEEAGNFIRRPDPEHLAAICREAGFERVAFTRYLMKYGHPPSKWWKILDNSIGFSLAKALFLGFGSGMFGPWGNKLAFVAERTEVHA